MTPRSRTTWPTTTSGRATHFSRDPSNSCTSRRPSVLRRRMSLLRPRSSFRSEAKEDGAAVTLTLRAPPTPRREALVRVDFGDGTADYKSGAVVEHVFKAAGDLTVTLVVVDARGQSSSTSSPITIAKADGAAAAADSSVAA